MTKREKVKGFALKYHLEWSKSCYQLVTNPLKSYLQVDFSSWNGRGLHLRDLKAKYKKRPLIFFQYPPPQMMLQSKNENLVWVPMWDHIRGYGFSWWQDLPKTLKVVAFSQEVYKRAKKSGLRTLKLKYYPNPNNFNTASFEKKRVLFYWNRIGMFDRQGLIQLCLVLKIDKLIFLSINDPKISLSSYFSLPEKVGKMKVHQYDNFLPWQVYTQIVQEANIYIAPRFYEGVGISFIEALCRGCLVLAYNAPTMSEYINHMENGYLFSKISKGSIGRGFLKKAFYHTRFKHFFEKKNMLNIDYQKMRNLDAERLGKSAYSKAQSGYKNWEKSKKTYAEFITS